MAEAERPIQAVPIWRVVVGGLIVVGIISILCWRLGWCWWCPRCPDVDCCGDGDYAAEIILEDMHAGVWMAMDNNAFLFKDPPDADHPPPVAVCPDVPDDFGACADNYETGDAYRHGVLFQTGPVVLDDLSFSRQYGGVQIEHDGGEAWLLPGEDDDFDWLDVMETGTQCVIDPHHAYEMVHNIADEGNSDDHITLHGDAATTEDIVLNDCDSLEVDSVSDFTCLRNRSVHASLIPTRILTYWAGQGPDFYEMAATPTEEIPIVHDGGFTTATHGPSHVSYTFRLPEETVVDRWKGGCFQERYTGVTLIRILFNGGPEYDLGYPHRPMDGGK